MISRQDEAHLSAVTIESASDVSPQVLVVEDSQLIRELIVWLVRVSGYRAIAAENGLAAQLLLIAARPTLIVTDLNMPLCDGWELLAFCHGHHPEIPVMIVSSEGMGRHPEIERWAAGYVPKPFHPDQLRAEINRLVTLAIGRAAARKALTRHTLVRPHAPAFHQTD